MSSPSNVTPFPTPAVSEEQLEVWKRESVVRSFNHGSRQAIPLAPQMIDVVHRVIAIHDLTVERVLDLGAGDGFAAASVMERYPLKHLVLVDFSQPMLEEAKGHFKDAPFPVEYVEGDLRDDAWWPGVQRSGPFDLVISRFAIHHIADELKQKLYAQVFQFLRPGGVFVNIEHVKSGSATLQEAFDRLMIEGIVRQGATEETREEIVTSYKARQDKDVNILAPVEMQLEWLRSDGFADVDCVFKLFELSVLTGRRPE
ncbi:MAG: class I SAM-dependent methyltransferase [Thermomicrobiales bacterium]